MATTELGSVVAALHKLQADVDRRMAIHAMFGMFEAPPVKVEPTKKKVAKKAAKKQAKREARKQYPSSTYEAKKAYRVREHKSPSTLAFTVVKEAQALAKKHPHYLVGTFSILNKLEEQGITFPATPASRVGQYLLHSQEFEYMRAPRMWFWKKNPKKLKPGKVVLEAKASKPSKKPYLKDLVLAVAEEMMVMRAQPLLGSRGVAEECLKRGIEFSDGCEPTQQVSHVLRNSKLYEYDHENYGWRLKTQAPKSEEQKDSPSPVVVGREQEEVEPQLGPVITREELHKALAEVAEAIPETKPVEVTTLHLPKRSQREYQVMALTKEGTQGFKVLQVARKLIEQGPFSTVQLLGAMVSEGVFFGGKSDKKSRAATILTMSGEFVSVHKRWFKKGKVDKKPPPMPERAQRPKHKGYCYATEAQVVEVAKKLSADIGNSGFNMHDLSEACIKANITFNGNSLYTTKLYKALRTANVFLHDMKKGLWFRTDEPIGNRNVPPLVAPVTLEEQVLEAVAETTVVNRKPEEPIKPIKLDRRYLYTLDERTKGYKVVNQALELSKVFHEGFSTGLLKRNVKYAGVEFKDEVAETKLIQCLQWSHRFTQDSQGLWHRTT